MGCWVFVEMFFLENLVCCGLDVVCLSGWFCIDGGEGSGVCYIVLSDEGVCFMDA